MKKKNSIILMLVVLITMFVNVNKAQAVTCNYTISGSIPVNIQTAIDKKKNKVTVSASSNCYIKLNGKGTSSQIQSCSGKTGKNTVYDYDSSCAKGDLKYSASKTLTNSKDCPKKLCMKKKSNNKKKTSKKEKEITCYYRAATVQFHVVINKTAKKISISEFSDCQINSNFANINKCNEKSTTKIHEYDYIDKCDTSIDNYYDSSYEEDNKKAGCPAKLCMSKISEDKVNEPKNAKTSDSSKKNETAKSLKFENKTGCNLWGGLLDTIKMIFTVIKWFLGVGLVILSMVDFAKAVIGSEPEEDLAKAKKKLTTRIIVLIIIFLVPAILDLLLNNVLGVETCIDKIQ